jgi:tripartite-type tricarboxylate transporter receptor subunit TctC
MLKSPWLLAAAAAIWFAPEPLDRAQAQGFPERPIKLVVPFPAGGPTDTSARLVAQGMSLHLPQPVVIENQGGAGGIIGARQVVNANPDGYTLLMVAIANTYGVAPILYKLDYDPMKAFAPVATAVVDRQIMVGTPSLPVNSVQELVQYAKANPGKLNYGAAIGIGPHFLTEMFKIKTGANIVHVPYRGSGAIFGDVISGQIQLTMSGKSVLLPFVQAGKMKALAVTSAARWPELPNVPSLYELGYLDFPYDTTFGVVAPAGTPPAVIARLNSAINEGLNSPEIRAGIAKLGIDPKIGTPQEFAATIAEEGPRWAQIVKATGIKAAE